MTTESTARTIGMRGEPRSLTENAAKVLETTRRAWSETRTHAPREAKRSPPRTLPKKRVVPRRSRWPSLIAALNYWSPKPL
ncbi:hypothetical protein AWB74_02193 [Caballeronia arvi]|uniref:Uncharacterized protein n=1 Tax=Caballeronia arvi TaxID=1777135 RepID=A0A158HUZ6_9BURK|nr:hypothetical protein [Caballeronia arvi]SAL48146.1 hypothetical protein AWB74_02193 [Caballeronia arvi]